jgi:hypothetical protein
VIEFVATVEVETIALFEVLLTTTRYVIGADESIAATGFQFTVMPVAVKLLRVVITTTVGVAAVVVTDKTFDGSLTPTAFTARTRNEYAVFAVSDDTLATVVEVVSCLVQLPAV